MNFRRKDITILFCFFFIAFCVTYPDPSLEASSESLSADRQFGFAESLFSEGDYYRAITEYKRYIYLYPKDENIDRAYLGIARSYFNAKKWSECIDSVNIFSQKIQHSPLLTHGFYLKALSYKNLQRYDDALTIFHDILSSSTDRNIRERSMYQIALIYMELEEWDKARTTLLLIPESSELFQSAKNVSESLEYINNIPEKSPVTAGILAALMPGAGHLYAERPRDALIAFLVNGAFILASFEQYRNDHHVTAGILFLFELGWYFGNIYSAMNSAHKYNKKAKKEFLDLIKKDISISFIGEEKRPCAFFQLSFSF